MPLVPAALSQSLQSQWLPRDENGDFKDDASASAQALAGAVADWFGKSGEAPNTDIVTRVDADAFYALLGESLARYRETVGT